ncbi:uncharacterized protein P884DRAFT_44867 [Thermothelomyces heterothallicus CBS 202.75]|uniref:uncharacterized protein n=1 Tax=Thermothelomyces heterothallicus CBS 202.75 TaxID=1149848 RepID=UPI0037434A96
MALSDNWPYQRLEELKDLLDRGMGAIDDGAPSPESRVDFMREQFFYGSRYFGSIPQVFQEQAFDSIARMAADERHKIASGNHATLQLGLCLLSGFGVDRDIHKGLELVFEAADKGNNRARAVIGRLLRSFDNSTKSTPLKWVIEQAIQHSYWAIEELGRADQRFYSEAVERIVFLAATDTGRVGYGPDYFEELVESRFDLFDPNALEEQIKKEFGPASGRAESPAPDGPTRPSNSSPFSRFPAQVWPEPTQGLETVTADGGNALGLVDPVSQLEPPQASEPVGFDEDNALGLFSPLMKHERHQRPETPIASSGLHLASSELPATWQEEVGKDHLLGVFTRTVTEGDMLQPREPVAEETASSPTSDELGEVGEEISEASAFGLFVPATGANALGLLTPVASSDSPTLEAPTRDSVTSPTRDTNSADPYPLQHEQTMPGQPNVLEDGQVADEMQLQPADFFDVAMRFVCCYGLLETLPVLLRQQPRLAPDLGPEMYIPVALAAGQGEVALALLGSEIEITKETNPYLLFQLHHLPPQQVGPVAGAIVSRGFDPNEKVELHRDSRFTKDRLSVFLDPVLDHRMHPPDGSFRHWLPEIRGRSLTPLRWALYHGNEHVVGALLDLGAEFARLPDVDRCVAHGGPVDRLETAAFTVAVLEEPCLNLNILEMFFQRHGDQPGRAVFAETPLGLIAMEPDCPERRLRFSGPGGETDNLERVLSLLRRHQPDSDAQLFWAAAMNGHEDIVRYLINDGVHIELRYNGQTPLHTAVLHGQKGVFDLLVKNGADVRALTSDKGMSMMHLLLWKPKPVGTELYMINELYRLLGSVAGGSGDFGRKVQPIHLAALNSRVAALERLLELGADPTVPIEEDIMPWTRGCFRHEGWEPPETLKRDRSKEGSLLATPISLKGLTPAGIILSRYDIMPPKDLLAMLRILVLSTSFPVTLSRLYTRPSLKQTIFHLLACHFPLVETGILEHLLDGLARLGKANGADRQTLINLPDADGDTPLHYAALFSGSRNTRAVDRLLSLGADPTARNLFGMTPGVMRARCLARKGAAATEDAVLRSATGKGGNGARASYGDGGKWGSKLVQFGRIPLSPKERFAAAGDSSSDEAGGEGQGGGGGDDPGVRWSTRYWGGRTASCMRLQELSGEDAEPDGIKMMGQLLRGARVREVWDLHAGRWVRFEREMMVQLVTEADTKVDFAREGRTG